MILTIHKRRFNGSLKSILFMFQKAEAPLAYELQAAKIQQKIRNEEIQIQVKASSDYSNSAATDD